MRFMSYRYMIIYVIMGDINRMELNRRIELLLQAVIAAVAEQRNKHQASNIHAHTHAHRRGLTEENDDTEQYGHQSSSCETI